MDNKNLNNIRHTSQHVFQQALKELNYKVYQAIGPTIEEGFYADFEILQGTISEEDFEKIEAKMQEIINRKLEMKQKQVPAKQALEFFKGNPYKQELIHDLDKKGEKITFWVTGDESQFVDLCKGPHTKNTKDIKAFKLLSIAGAYWRGDEKNKMLTRVYGTAFESKKELDNYLELLEEAKKRDHRKLGPQLGIFMLHETAPGDPYWLPNGVVIINELMSYWAKDHKVRGYKETSTPLVNKKELYETSGHWEHYRDDMFIADMGENEVYGIKPMNCPNAMVIFGSKTRSYKELPLRLSDTDRLHRYERSGTLHGLLRVRGFRQDDAHIFVTEDQIEDEYKRIFEIAKHYYGLFGLEYKFRLGTRPEGYLGDIETWNKAESILEKVLKESGKDYYVQEGDGAFYGPKVDIVMKDTIGREWQTGTIQLDFQLARRFNLKYADENGEEKTPIVIHRVVYGSIERFMGILIEHFAGAFPIWLAPVQVQIIPISEKSQEYAKSVAKELDKNNVRFELDSADETMGNKIRKAQEQKVPYMLIVGEKEASEKKVSIRNRDGGQQNMIDIDKFIKNITKLIGSKSLEL